MEVVMYSTWTIVSKDGITLYGFGDLFTRLIMVIRLYCI